MHFTQGTALLLAVATAARAFPLEEPKGSSHQLFARGAKWDKSCARKIPGGDKTFEEKARQAFTDASELAKVAREGKDLHGNEFTESTAFSHYFGEGDKDQVKEMMKVIYNSRLVVEDGGLGYNIDIFCGSDTDDACQGNSGLAATNPRPGQTSMVLCDRFFNKNTQQTKQDLTSKKIGSRRGQWCQEGEKFGFFEVAGLTLMHEMTHLHTVGHQAGLAERPDPDGFTSAGTVDVYEQGQNTDKDHYKNKEPWQAARELHRLWEAHAGDQSKYKPLTPTVENAESYAAAALEFYFLNHCKWDVIDRDS